jgi:hypothetical protein
VWSELLPIARDYGPFGLMALMVILGWLVPRVTHRERLADKDLQIARLTTALDKAEGQRDRLLGLADVTVGIVRSLPTAKDPVS